MTDAALFAAECGAAGIRVPDGDRDLVFELWRENLPRRTALRHEAFALDEAPAQPMAIPPTGRSAEFQPVPESNEALHFKPISELIGLLAAGKLSATELLSEQLNRINRFDSVLHAFEAVHAQAATEAARAADHRRARGSRLSPLDGIPFGVKSLIAVEGQPHTAGSHSRREIVARADAPLLAHLRAAGGVLIGQNRTHEFGAGMATAEGPLATGRNPWNIERIPGGSSSGSAVAVASGMLPGSVGTDSAGSIRMPAGNCNIVGFKPSFGLIPSEGLVPYAWSLDTPGPMTRTVTDAALMLEGMLGQSEFGTYSAELNTGLKGKVIGVPRRYFWDRDDIRDDVRNVCDGALEVLARAGAVLRDVEIDGVDWNDAIYTTLLAETWAIHRTAIDANPDTYGDWFRAHAIAGGIVSASDLIAAHRMRGRLARAFAAVLAEVDVLVVPGQAVPATPFSNSFGTALTQPRSQFMRPFNVTGLPAIAVPAGFSADGLPLSINFAGPACGDRQVLEVAAAYEAETMYWRQHPDVSAWKV